MPIDVHLLGSDLDIVCCVRSPDRFSSLLIERFYRRPSTARLLEVVRNL